MPSPIRVAGRRTALLVAWVVAVALIAPAAVPAQELPPGGTFRDDDGNVHEGNIEAIAAAGITHGCDTEQYCPSDTVTRGQMAAFIDRAIGLPAATTDHFTDDGGSGFENAINRVAQAGITRGCDASGTLYCPNDLLTRGQMAAFLARAYGYADGAGSDRFSDDDGSIFESAIERLAEAGVTSGCSAADPALFCPHDDIRRDQMATFLARAEGLDPIVPPVRCAIFPADNVWNRRVDDLPVHARSDAYIASIGSSTTLHPDFGSGVWPPGSDSPIGIPYVEVEGDEPLVPVVWTAYGGESDDGPYPTPLDAPVEGGPDGDGDRHVISLDVDNCVLYELYRAFPVGGSWNADSGAVYDLRSNDLRPDGWTSADAAGLPIFPGLIRYEEVLEGVIDHPIRFTASQTQRAYVWPARHFASSITDPDVPPMGQRFRLRADFDIGGFSPEVQIILTAFKRYGLILADNGSDWFISGAPDERWDNDMLRELKDIPGSAFEAIDVSGLIVDPDSGQVGG